MHESPYEVVILAADGLGGAKINSHRRASLKMDNGWGYIPGTTTADDGGTGEATINFASEMITRK